MWTAKFKTIDKNGLRPEMKVTVIYYNDVDSTVYENIYDVSPEDLKSDTFLGIVQAQLDILNLKDDKNISTNITLDDLVIK